MGNTVQAGYATLIAEAFMGLLDGIIADQVREGFLSARPLVPSDTEIRRAVLTAEGVLRV